VLFGILAMSKRSHLDFGGNTQMEIIAIFWPFIRFRNRSSLAGHRAAFVVGDPAADCAQC
jgi:hypothetical protein